MTNKPKGLIEELADVCAHKTGQSYKLRSLLYSLWNGKPASLNEVTGLDYELKIKLCMVILAFGTPEFFYDEIESAFVKRGIFDWFCEEGETK